MTYDIYLIENGMATRKLADCKNDKELNEWRRAHQELKGQYIVHNNWDSPKK